MLMMLKQVSNFKLRLHEKYFIIAAVGMFFLSGVLYLSSLVYQSYVDIAIRRRNYIRVEIYTDMIAQQMRDGTIFLAIGVIFVVIAYLVYRRRTDTPLY